MAIITTAPKLRSCTYTVSIPSPPRVVPEPFGVAQGTPVEGLKPVADKQNPQRVRLEKDFSPF